MKNTKIGIIALLVGVLFFSCEKKEGENTMKINESTHLFSLAQWSLHKAIEDGEMDALDFADSAKAMGFTGLEYVSQLYKNHWENEEDRVAAITELGNKLKHRSDSLDMQNLIVMIDNEGDLAVSDSNVVNEAIENHKIWIDFAQQIGAHSIRINLFGEGTREEMHSRSVHALTALGDYAADKMINVIVENHGGLSSDGEWLSSVMKEVGKMNVGTLPDFGNFCVRRENDERWGAPCVEEYDRYKGMTEILPYAKGVSAKSYAFDADGEETTIDYAKMIQLINEAGFEGYIGVEFEGEEISEAEGIKKTLELLKKHL